MVLKALEIQGFKSFPDKTKITFDQGITAVVGPNGSGKSNISDAIRWVLGETSSRQLRGSGKMEDVIFGGTQKRSGMGYAVVNLTVDNSDRRIDVDKDEVVIGRKYYRSGESEYSINGQHVRLKDILSLVRDALQKVWQQKTTNGERFLKKPLEFLSIATEKMRQNAVWLLRKII